MIKQVLKGVGEITIAKEADEKSGDTSQINGGDNNITKKNKDLERYSHFFFHHKKPAKLYIMGMFVY